jgi:hypothetical protein
VLVLSVAVALALALLIAVPLAYTDNYPEQVFLPLFAALVAACLAVLRSRLRAGWDRASAALFAVLGGVSLLNASRAGQHIEVDRDPGLYWYRALRLAQSGTPDARAPEGPFASGAAIATTGDGFDSVAGTSEVWVQFLSASAIVSSGLVPAFGWRAPMVASALLLVIAAAALGLMVRRATSGWWAVVASGSLSLSLPWIYFGRLPYSEPLAAAFMLAGLLGLSLGVLLRAPALLVLGAGISGFAATARVDAGIALSGAVLAVTVLGRQRGLRRAVLLMALTATLVGTAIALVDLRLNSPVYLSALRVEYTGVLLAHLGSLSLAALLVLSDRAWRAFCGLRRFLGPALLVALSAWLLLWFLGPHLLELRLPGPPYEQTALQMKEGLAADTGRTYGERLPERLVIATGVLIPALAVLGLLRLRSPQAPMLAPVLAAGAATTTVYALRASITPDLVWALRRLLPVVIPAMVVLAVVALAGSHLPRRAQALLGVALLLSSLTTSLPILTAVERRGTFGGLEALCRSLPADSAAIFVSGSVDRLARPAELTCGVPTARAARSVDMQELLHLSDQWLDHGRQLVVVSDRPPQELGLDGVPVIDVIRWTDQRLERTLIRRPEELVTTARTAYVSSVVR